MENWNFILAGLGGQGILFMTKLISQSAMRRQYCVMGAETHGMAQRGGAVVSHIRLGEVESSLVRPGSAHFILSLDENEAYRNLPYIAPKGRIYASAPEGHSPNKEVKAYLDKMDVTFRALPAARVALDLEAPIASNLVLLGFFSAFEDRPVNQQDIMETIEEVSPDRFRSLNLRVFEKGLSLGRRKKDNI